MKANISYIVGKDSSLRVLIHYSLMLGIVRLSYKRMNASASKILDSEAGVTLESLNKCHLPFTLQ